MCDGHPFMDDEKHYLNKFYLIMKPKDESFELGSIYFLFILFIF